MHMENPIMTWQIDLLNRLTTKTLQTLCLGYKYLKFVCSDSIFISRYEMIAGYHC